MLRWPSFFIMILIHSDPISPSSIDLSSSFHFVLRVSVSGFVVWFAGNERFRLELFFFSASGFWFILIKLRNFIDFELNFFWIWRVFLCSLSFWLFSNCMVLIHWLKLRNSIDSVLKSVSVQGFISYVFSVLIHLMISIDSELKSVHVRGFYKLSSLCSSSSDELHWFWVKISAC